MVGKSWNQVQDSISKIQSNTLLLPYAEFVHQKELFDNHYICITGCLSNYLDENFWYMYVEKRLVLHIGFSLLTTTRISCPR